MRPAGSRPASPRSITERERLERVQGLIALANLAPPDVDVPRWDTMEEELSKMGTSLSFEMEAKKQEGWVKKRFPGSRCLALRNHLNGPGGSQDANLTERYSAFAAIHETLWSIARMNRTGKPFGPGHRIPIASSAESLLLLAS